MPPPLHRIALPLALAGAAGGALWIFLNRGLLPGAGPGAGFIPLLYAWWAPGLLVGLALGAALGFEPHRALAFATVTGGIYLASVGVVVAAGGLLPGPGPLPLALEGAAAGGGGAWLFHAAILHYLEAGPRRASGLPTATGAVIGGLLVHLLTLPAVGRLPVVLICAAWPAVVGSLSCRIALRRRAAGSPTEGAAPAAERGTRAERERGRAGIVEVMGLAITVASVLSLLRALP